MSLSGRAATPTAIPGPGLVLLQLNVEGLTTAKLNIIQQIITKNNVIFVLLQETHTDNNKFLKLPGLSLTAHTDNKHHGIATYVRTDISWTAIAQSADDAEIEWTRTKLQDTNIVNIYKPTPSKLVHISLPNIRSPALYAGDFNCQHIDWAYKNSNADSDFLVEWASSIDATLLYNLKEPRTFY